MLYDETDHEAAAAMRASIVAKAERSDAAKRKQTTGRTDDGLPVHSFQSLLADLATPSCDTAELSPGRAVGKPAYMRLPESRAFFVALSDWTISQLPLPRDGA